MPEIRQNKAQKEALEFISAALADIEAINTVTSETNFNAITIQFSKNNGKRNKNYNIIIDPADKDFDALVRLLETKRSRLTREIRSKSAKHDIVLTVADEAILSGVKEPQNKVEQETDPAQGEQMKLDSTETTQPNPQDIGPDNQDAPPTTQESNTDVFQNQSPMEEESNSFENSGFDSNPDQSDSVDDDLAAAMDELSEY